MSPVELGMLSTLVLVALTGVAVIATRRSFWLFGLGRMRWVTGKISLAATPRNDKAQIVIGVRESYKYRNKTWEREKERRILPEATFTATGGEPARMQASGARWLFRARRWHSGSETEVERAVRDGDAVTLVFSDDARAAQKKRPYREGAADTLRPFAIFAGDMRDARVRLRIERARLALPFVVILIAAAYLTRVHFAL